MDAIISKINETLNQKSSLYIHLLYGSSMAVVLGIIWIVFNQEHLTVGIIMLFIGFLSLMIFSYLVIMDYIKKQDQKQHMIVNLMCPYIIHNLTKDQDISYQIIDTEKSDMRIFRESRFYPVDALYQVRFGITTHTVYPLSVYQYNVRQMTGGHQFVGLFTGFHLILSLHHFDVIHPDLIKDEWIKLSQIKQIDYMKTPDELHIRFQLQDNKFPNMKTFSHLEIDRLTRWLQDMIDVIDALITILAQNVVQDG